MPIYTRKGDKGKTSLFGGTRVSKADLRVEAYGTVDELNSVIGVVLSEIQNSKVKNQNYKSKVESKLTEIQNNLLDIGAMLANPDIRSQKLGVSSLSKRVKEFEDFIDEMTDAMPKLSNFILPGGGKTGAILQFARAVSRRAERRVVKLAEKEAIDSNIVMYMNRLSYLLFTMARFINFKEKQKEIIWNK